MVDLKGQYASIKEVVNSSIQEVIDTWNFSIFGWWCQLGQNSLKGFDNIGFILFKNWGPHV